MWLKKLSVLQFKNYEEAILDFSPEVNVFSGDNGAGKTNLLDAIHYLSLCKSYFNPVDSHHIKEEMDWFMVHGDFVRDDSQDRISCVLKRNQKKLFTRNKKEYGRLADHIGHFPLVMISPSDGVIIMDGSEERRKFMDNVLSQTDARYLDSLISYNKLLSQRNSLLKASARATLDMDLLDVLNRQMSELGTAIFEKRKDFMDSFIPVFNQHYQWMSDDAETVSLAYHSPLQEQPFPDLLLKNLEKDRALERTTQGIHKDDLLFTIHAEKPLKRFASQGQQKSFLIALKLAQYTYLKQKKGFKPMLLLDDVFDKLDNNRMTKLMAMVSDEEFGQIFITDTDAERIKRIFEEIGREITLFAIQKGSVKEVSYEKR